MRIFVCFQNFKKSDKTFKKLRAAGRPSEKQGWFSDGLAGLALFVVGFGKPILRGGVGIEYLPHQRGQRVHAQAARQREALQ